MFCTNCGTQLKEGSRFCTECGEPAAQVITVEAANPAQKALLVDTQSRQRKGHKLGKAALILGIIAIVLSLAFAPFIYMIFSRLDMTMTSEEWGLAIITVFLYLIIKYLGVFLEGLASASLFILPCLLIQLTGLTLAIVGRAVFKDKKLATPAIFVNAGGLLLQMIIVIVCMGAGGNVPIN